MSPQMRITEGMVSTRLLNDLRRAENASNLSSAQISSGRRLLDASIDPHATYRALRLRQELTSSESLRETVSLSKGWMETTEQALDTITDSMHRARELVVQAGSGALQLGDRVAIANEISAIIESVKLAANARFDDSYVFGGQVTDTPPYSPMGADTYSGDGAGVIRTIGPGVSMQINVTGASVLGDGTDGRFLNTLRDIHANLVGGTAANVNALQTTDLANLSTNLQSMLATRAVVGTGLARLEHADGRLADQALTSTGFLEDAEATDMTATILRLNSERRVYQAALSSGASIIQPSLMDFLR